LRAATLRLREIPQFPPPASAWSHAGMSKAYGLSLLAIALFGGLSVLAIDLGTRARASDGERGAAIEVAAAAPARAPAPAFAAPAIATTAPPAYAPAPYAAPASPTAYAAPHASAPFASAAAPAMAITADDADVEAERAERLAKRGRARRPRAQASPE
jgi:hypothetical protein